MVNTLSPFGFRQLRMYEGVQPTYGSEELLIASSDATPIYTGDPVVTNFGPSGTGGFAPYVTAGSTNLQATYTSTGELTNLIPRGIFMGCEYYNTNVGRMVWSAYWPGGGGGVSSAVDARCWIATDPRVLYIVQASTSTVIGTSQFGQSFILSSGSSAGSNTTGISGAYLNSSSPQATTGVTVSGGFQLVDFYSRYAPPGGGGQPGLGVPFSSAVMATASPLINGTDNSNGGQIVVVRISGINGWQT